MPDNSPRSKYAGSQCAYCDQGATTKDHVIPRSLFDPPCPINMITVPCCKSCNAEKKLADDFLRDYLVAIIDEYQSPVAEKIKTGTLQRAVDRNQSKLHKELGALTQIMSISEIPREVLNPIVVEPLRKYLWFAVRGLFHSEAKMRIPLDHKLMFHKLDGLDALDQYNEMLFSRGPVKEIRIGDQQVFGCIAQSVTTKGILKTTFWGLIFYSRTYICCMTTSPDVLETLPEHIKTEFH